MDASWGAQIWTIFLLFIFYLKKKRKKEAHKKKKNNQWTLQLETFAHFLHFEDSLHLCFVSPLTVHHSHVPYLCLESKQGQGQGNHLKQNQTSINTPFSCKCTCEQWHPKTGPTNTPAPKGPTNTSAKKDPLIPQHPKDPLIPQPKRTH